MRNGGWRYGCGRDSTCRCKCRYVSSCFILYSPVSCISLLYLWLGTASAQAHHTTLSRSTRKSPPPTWTERWNTTAKRRFRLSTRGRLRPQPRCRRRISPGSLARDSARWISWLSTVWRSAESSRGLRMWVRRGRGRCGAAGYGSAGDRWGTEGCGEGRDADPDVARQLSASLRYLCLYGRSS